MPSIRESSAITSVNGISASHLPAQDTVSEIGSHTVLSPISKEHTEKHFLKLNELRLSHQLCDITLIVGEKNIVAHKIVLSASSAYFSAKFTSDMAESEAATVELHDLDGDAVGLIIDFVYTAQLPVIDDSNVQVLLSAASLLQVEEIQRSCCDYLKQQLDTSNCLGIREESIKYSCPDLFHIAKDLSLDKFEEVIKNDEFLQLRADRLIEIISDDKLNVISEEHLYEAVMRWMGYKSSPDDEDRIVHLADVLDHVRFSQMSPDYIVEVSRNELIKSSERCRENIEEAKNYLLSHRLHTRNGESPEVPDRFREGRFRPRINCNYENLYVVRCLVSESNESRIERYDIQTNGWTTLARTNQRRQYAGVGALNGVIYAIGGFDDGVYLKSTQSYHVDTDEWKSGVIAPLSSGRHSMGVTTLNGFLYVIGGTGDTGCNLNLVEKYDPISNKWSTCAPLETGRSQHGVATLDGYIYVVGGSRVNVFALNTVERYDPNLDLWQSVAPMRGARKNLGCAAFGGFIYAAGGNFMSPMNFDERPVSSVQRYDSSKDIWESIPSMSERRSCFGAAFVNGLLYAVGGFNGRSLWSVSNTVEVYDPDQNVWSSRASMLNGRETSTVVSVSMKFW